MPVKLKASSTGIIDSLLLAMQSKPVLTGGLDNKGTFVSGNTVDIKGLEIGVSYNNKISYMLGYYWLKYPLHGFATINKGTINEKNCNTRAYINYVSFIAEYTLLKQNRWSVYMPFQIGYGKAKKDYLEKNTFLFSKKSTIIPVELAVTGNYRVWKFLGLSGGLGFRAAPGANIIKDEDFNGLTYSFGLKIWFADLCYLILPKCKYCNYL